MSSEIEIHLTAIDDASDVIQRVGANTAEAMGEVQTAGEGITKTTENVGSSVKDTALGFNNLATAGMGLYMAFDRIEHSQVALDRANLTLERSTRAAQDAQEAYNEAVAKYGPDSAVAKDAAEKLKIAEDAHEVALERVRLAQSNMNTTMIMTGLTVIPSLITAVTSLGRITESVTGITKGLGVAMDFLAANPIVLVIAGIAALVAGLIWAYENCAPFRDAINAIGAALGGALLTAVNAIRDAFTWLWQNVLVPVGSFIVNNFVVSINQVRDALDWLWKNILEPIADFLKGTFLSAIDTVSKALKPIQDVANTLGGAAKAVGGAMGDVAGAVGGGLSKAGSAISGFISSICFSHALQKAADESAVTMEDWADMIGDQTAKGLGAIKDFNKEAGFAGVGPMAGAGAGVSPVTAAYGAAKGPITIMISAPLVNIEGSADKATADLATKQMVAQLKSILVEATSPAASTRRIRIPVLPR